MGAILSIFAGPAGKVIGVFLLIGIVCGAGYTFVLKYDDMQQSVVIAQQDKATAEASLVTATAAAQSNALIAAQTERQGEQVAATLTAQKNAAVKRASTLSATLTEIQNAPHTSDCVRASVIGDSLERVRSAQAARAALAGQGPSPASDASAK